MGKHRIGASLLAFAAVVHLHPALADEPEPPPPSLLLVTLDTTRADHLGCYGAAFAATPILDALARDGVRFDRALSPAPLTLPSHASMFTGLVPRRHGVRDNASYRLDGGPPVLAEILGSHGYRTAGFVSSVVLDRVTGIARGFDHYDDTVRVGERAAFQYVERAASQTNAAVLPYVSGLEPPFFLWVHYFDPHLPYVPPAPYRERFAGRLYDGEIAFMDHEIGALLRAVRSKATNLLVVVAGDHGESLGEHGEAAHGIFVYQSTQHVPLILAGHGVPRGNSVPASVGLVDLLPTVLDLLDVEPPPGLDGRSVVPALSGKGARDVDYELETMFPSLAYGWAPLRALVRGDRKYVDAPAAELYRLDRDPGEIRNLLPALAEEASSLKAVLLKRIAGDRIDRPARETVSAEHRQKLEALGYVTGGDVPEAGSGIDPKDGVAWIADLEAGRRAYQTGRPQDGVAPLERLLSRNPANVPALLALGLCRLGMGEPAKAVVADRRALAVRPDDELVHFNLANALAALGVATGDRAALDEARSHYRRAIGIQPRYAEAYLNYASFLIDRGSPNEARAVLERARAAGVRDPDIETRLAVLELGRGEVEAAKRALVRSLELNPDAEKPLMALARITERRGEYEDAARYYRRLLAVAPSPDTAKALGAVLLHGLDDREGARDAYGRALALSTAGSPDRASLERIVRELSLPPEDVP